MNRNLDHQILCFLIPVLLPIVSCNQMDSESGLNIINGTVVAQDADQRVANSTIGIYSTQQKGLETCTGTLIGPHHIVTAAHCVKGMSTVGISWGNKLTGPNSAVTVTGYTSYPSYQDGSRDFDIGIISFSGTLPSNMQPVPLAASSQPQRGQELLLAGYGQTTNDDSQSNIDLRQVKVKVDIVDTSRRVVDIEKNTKRGGCFGDSGGPAFVEESGSLKLVGATSGPGTGYESVSCDAGHGTWTMVNLYQSWMKCSFEKQNNPLTTLANDNSGDTCNQASSPPSTNNPSTSLPSNPSTSPTSNPSTTPTSNPNTSPPSNPSTSPTSNPSTSPTSDPNTYPPSNPSTYPTSNPSTYPTSDPSTYPTSNPSTYPTDTTSYP